jgi:hypothetical protein
MSFVHLHASLLACVNKNFYYNVIMEIIPKEKFSKPIRGLKILFYFSLSLLFFSIIAIFVLNHFHAQAEKENERLKIILTTKIPERITLQQEVLNYQNKVNNFSFLIDQELKNSKLINNFEKIIHPQIWFSEFNLNSREGIIVLFGHGQSFKALKEQIFIIKKTEWIKNFNLDKLTMAEGGGVDFNLIIFFNPDILK